MGYSYGRTASGRSGLSCDSCGSVGQTRKRVCPYTVLSSSSHSAKRFAVPYSPAPALCPACFKAEGGIRGVHGQDCKDGAAAAQVKAAGVDRQRRLLALCGLGFLGCRRSGGPGRRAVPLLGR